MHHRATTPLPADCPSPVAWHRLKQHYAMLGVPHRVQGHKLEFGHNNNARSRRLMYGFFNQHFALGLPEQAVRPGATASLFFRSWACLALFVHAQRCEPAANPRREPAN